jgi:hypothetical protein
MDAPNQQSQAWNMAVQVAAANAMRGLLVHELQEDPAVGSVVMECSVDGSVTVTLCGADGNPLSGFAL